MVSLWDTDLMVSLPLNALVPAGSFSNIQINPSKAGFHILGTASCLRYQIVMWLTHASLSAWRILRSWGFSVIGTTSDSSLGKWSWTNPILRFYRDEWGICKAAGKHSYWEYHKEGFSSFQGSRTGKGEGTASQPVNMYENPLTPQSHCEKPFNKFRLTFLAFIEEKLTDCFTMSNWSHIFSSFRIGILRDFFIFTADIIDYPFIPLISILFRIICLKYG